MSQIVMQPRGELDRDRVEKLDCLEVFRTLTDAMQAYQNGVGGAPLVGDVENWKALVAKTLQQRSAVAPNVA